MSEQRRSIKPTYDHRETGDRFMVEVREDDRRLSIKPISDPFHNTTVHPRGWRVALAVLRRRYKVTVIVSGDSEIVEDVIELDNDYKGAHGSTRRAEWDEGFQRALGDFAARAGEHDTE